MNEPTRNPNKIAPAVRQVAVVFCAILAVSLLGAVAVSAQPRTTEAVKVMTHTAGGTFEVKMVPQGEPDSGPGGQLARMTLDKQFYGDLAAVGKGEMLTAMTETKGSAGYVAVERVTGTLHGREGSFVFLHRAVMSAAGQEISIAVVPDSGTDELTGIAGEFKIEIVDGKHFYRFTYSLPDATD